MADKNYRIAVSRSVACKRTACVEVVASDVRAAKSKAIKLIQELPDGRNWAYSFGPISEKLTADVL